MTACNAQQLLHSEQDPNNMEEIEDHRHIDLEDLLREQIDSSIYSYIHRLEIKDKRCIH